MRPFRPWPRSLAARTAVVLVLGLVVVQVVGLGIHALDRVELQRQADARDLRNRVFTIYRAVILAPPALREVTLRDQDLPPGATATLEPAPPSETHLPRARLDAEDIPAWRPPMAFARAAAPFRPREIRILGGPRYPETVIALRLPDGPWLTIRAPSPRPRLFHSPAFLGAFALMSITAALLTLWAVRRLTRPVRTLAAAAEALGRDVNAPPLPETGPTEVATAAAAFNTMAARIRRFVSDRTHLLTAIGHDLRTPITRLKLRAEFMEDDEQRKKMLADLTELEAMVTATLAFGRDSAATEPLTPLDLAELCRTLLDEATDTNPTLAEHLTYTGPAHLPIRARPLALKRALANLINNAITYGAAARLHLEPGNPVQLIIADNGPGIPPEELDRVFEPFRRLESSRNRETGGTGLGLAIARDIFRGMGGDVTLRNHPQKGLEAVVTLPA